eukprot:Lankesteria_metandrocarpae@DN4690_c0_g1_i3.p1
MLMKEDCKKILAFNTGSKKESSVVFELVFVYESVSPGLQSYNLYIIVVVVVCALYMENVLSLIAVQSLVLVFQFLSLLVRFHFSERVSIKYNSRLCLLADRSWCASGMCRDALGHSPQPRTNNIIWVCPSRSVSGTVGHS